MSTKSRFLRHFKFTVLPIVSKGNRDFAELRSDSKVWAYSVRERRTLGRQIEEEVAISRSVKYQKEYGLLVKSYEKQRAEYTEAYDIVRTSQLHC